MLRNPVPQRRALVAAATALVALLSLSGCYRIDMALTVHDNDTIDGTAILAIDKSVLSMTGSTIDDVFADNTMGDGTTAEPWTDGDLVGKKFTIQNESLDEFNKSGQDDGSSDNEGDLTVKHVNDTYVMDGTLDLTSGQDSSDASGIDMSGALSSGKVKIAITFPGAVVDANGEIDAKTHTVTWVPADASKPLVMHAVAQDSAGSTIAPWMYAAGGGVLLLVLLGVGALLVARSRRRDEPVADEGQFAPAGTAQFFPAQPRPMTPPAPTPPGAPQQ